MLGAFALELYLKGITAARSGGTFKTGHDLKVLFDNVPDADQSAIIRIYNNPPAAKKAW